MPRADSAPQMQTRMCVHTHTCCMHPPHAETSPCTDSHKNRHMHSCKHTQGHTHVRTHPCTGTHIAVWTGRRTNHPHANMCRHTDTRSAGNTTPTSPRFFRFVESAFPSPSWPTLLILQTSENQAPLDHDRLCFLQKELPANLGALELSVPRPPLSCAGEGFRDTGDHQVTSFRHSGASFPPVWRTYSHRTRPRPCEETEGSGGSSRTFCQEEVGAAAAGNGAGQA